MHTLSQLRSGELAGITRLDLSCGLTQFPPEIYSLADSLEILNLSGNALSQLPDDLPRLHKLKVIFCSDNQFSHLPEVLGRCEQLTMVGFKANQISEVSAAALPKNLRWLILTDNLVSTLPAELGQCHQLQKLMLAGNQLQSLPSLAACSRLQLIRISANQLTSLPGWLFTLPELAWLAYAGNPFCPPAAIHASPNINWQDLAIAELLGEGASGLIYKASWQPAGATPATVAVKLFKGALTSDGLPQNEMAACIAAGAHPGLIGALGQVDDHPEQIPALMMPLIDSQYINLAGPPSLASCTRDIYPAERRFTLQTTLKIASQIAVAAAHLHAAEILHGDLYAHNILLSPDGEALLGDFGAASFYMTGRHQALQQIEVRAYACLLEELLCRTETPDRALAELQQRCAAPLPEHRPLFSDICQRLAEISDEVSAA